jgi:hypothetical protein
MRLNKNWTNEDGTHDGGVAIGEKFTISWQRGPCSIGEIVKPSEVDRSILLIVGLPDRNGAFIIDVLAAAIMFAENPSIVWVSHDIGFTIVWQPETLPQVLSACKSQLEYFQWAGDGRLACSENLEAIEALNCAIASSPDLTVTAGLIDRARQILVLRRDRRRKEGTLGTAKGN